jgi:hypothetical protein
MNKRDIKSLKNLIYNFASLIFRGLPWVYFELRFWARESPSAKGIFRVDSCMLPNQIAAGPTMMMVAIAEKRNMLEWFKPTLLEHFNKKGEWEVVTNE